MAPFVLQTTTGFRMWYVSGKKISLDNKGVLTSEYDIKIAESENGLDWEKTGKSALPLMGTCTNISRAAISLENNVYTAWFSYKISGGNGYMLGTSTSTDGKTFMPTDFDAYHFDQNGQLPSWLQIDQCYPFSFSLEGAMYLAISGNHFGKAGFGLFKWENQ
jgi:hypothetical protein